MKKTFVLDTNVLLHDPTALFRFEENDVVLPITVIEELDRFKKRPEMIGRNARQVSRSLDRLRQKEHLTAGVLLEQGGMLRVALYSRATLEQLPPELYSSNGDNAILAVSIELQQQCPYPVVLISKDTNLRIKANALGLAAEDYETDKVDLDGLYRGMAEVMVASDLISQLFQQGKVSLENQDAQFFPNQALMFVDNANPNHTALAIVDGESGQAMPLAKLPHGGVSQIHARNREQKFALELLLRDSVSLVTLVGKAGTGKTLLAIAAGLQKVADERRYQRLLISRPIVPMGRDIGYLPGEVKEKLTPWMQPLYDNFDLIFGTQDTSERHKH